MNNPTDNFMRSVFFIVLIAVAVMDSITQGTPWVLYGATIAGIAITFFPEKAPAQDPSTKDNQ